MAMGVPMGACFARGSVPDAFAPGTHFSTFGGNPLACWAATRMAHWVRVNSQSIVNKGEALEAMLDEAMPDADAFGAGLLVGFHVPVDRIRFKEACFQRGLIIGAWRPGPGVVKLTPPLNATLDELSKGVDIMRDVLEDM
jgi:acetylornithine/succinyldiaminopimelate/putrescine aminotransferase